MLALACNLLWGGFIGASLITLIWCAMARGTSTAGSWAAFVATSLFFAASIFRDPAINRDILSYVYYSDLSRTMSALCFLIGVRFEPAQALIVWTTSNASGGYQLYFAVMAAIMIGSSAIILKVIGPKFLLFAALTFPQFGFINSMSTIRWGAALYALAAALALFDRANSFWRALGAGVGIMLHIGVAVAAAAGVVKHWAIRLTMIATGTAAIAFFLPTGEIASGSGIRYVLAFAASASLLFTAGATVKDDLAYRDHLVLISCAALMSPLYFVSPHLTRFAVALLFISYLPLVLTSTPLLKNRRLWSSHS